MIAFQGYYFPVKGRMAFGRNRNRIIKPKNTLRNDNEKRLNERKKSMLFK